MLIEQQLQSFPEQIKIALKTKKRISLQRTNKIVVIGMGGSGIVGSLLQDYLSDKLNIPIITAKTNLPKIDSKTLVLVISYSGNTKETINLYKKAKKITKPIIITSGGKLCIEKDAILVPKGFLPRLATPSLFFTILTILGKSKNIKLKNPQKLAKKIAKKLKNKIPIIYASEKFKSLAYKFQTDLNETAKVFAHSNFFPEINHNEIEANFPKNTKIFFLTDKDKPKSFKAVTIKLKGKNELEKLTYGLLLSVYTSYYLALLNKKDPVTTKNIEKIKK